MQRKSEPVLVVMSILAGLHVLFGGTALTTALGGHWLVTAIAATGNLAVAAAQVGMAFYVRGQVTPVDDVAPARAVPIESLGL